MIGGNYSDLQEVNSMTEFVRARSEEQKQARMAEIKAAADELFCSVPYQEITLSTIAGKLSWTRANLY